ncbi:spore germination protein [Chengkuizengella marina]
MGKKLKSILRRKNNKQKQIDRIDNKSIKSQFDSNLEQNIKKFKSMLGSSTDLEVRKFRVGKNGSYQVAFIYTDGLVDREIINNLLETLMINLRKDDDQNSMEKSSTILEYLENYGITIGGITGVNNFETAFDAILSGDTLLLIDGYSEGYYLATTGWEDRGVTEATSQTVVRGPHDSFTETLRTNTALIRRRIKNPNLWLETKQIGKRTRTDVAIMYIKDIAEDKVVQEVRNRLEQIDIDAILESGFIEELIQDETFTPFPTIYNSERPDVITAGLLEGRIAIFVDGTPYVLLVPALFIQFFQSPEDYYSRADIASAIRILRFFCFFITLLFPALYIGITTFHQEMIPTQLLISLAAQREGIPFPSFVEALIMEITFEILREAGIRMPRAVGQAVSIVGALVIGQAAVEAGIISGVMVIIVAMTAIASFVLPTYNMAISVRLLRFIFMILAATFGLFGIIVGLIALVLHLSSLKSFGVPYMAPMAPYNAQNQKDSLIRFPIWGLIQRPHLISQKNVVRQHDNVPTKSKK